MQNKTLLYLLLVLASSLLYSCSSEYNGDLPNYKPIPVLNGVLFADSTINIKLSWSVSPNTGSFPPITNAEVILYEDDVELPAPKQMENGLYHFSSIAKAGKRYRIIVLIDGKKAVSANTIMPVEPTTSVVHDKDYSTDWGHSKYDIEIGTFNNSFQSIYVYVYSLNDGFNPNIDEREVEYLYNNSPFADRFNVTIDSWGPTGYIMEFESFIRFPKKDIPSQQLNTDVACFCQSNKTEISLLFASEDFDLYYKGAFIQRTQTAYTEGIPTSYQPLFLPSNITNGAGIFAGVNLETFYYVEE